MALSVLFMVILAELIPHALAHVSRGMPATSVENSFPRIALLRFNVISCDAKGT